MATERKIGAHVYRCEKLPASEGLRLFMRVTQFFRAAPDMMASIAVGGADGAAISAFLVVALASDTDGDKAPALLIDLAQCCRVDGDKAIVGVKPAELSEVIQVAWLAMETNFRDFLSAGLAES